ncbi:MAG: hypothetical protein LBV79_12175 [Candidatus Adiutrix sp.]|jgi:hypothetical protein|nr:hypothetical protein [Candidatus Adiutrix sp.]
MKTSDRVPTTKWKILPYIAALFTFVMPFIFCEVGQYYRPSFYNTTPFLEALYSTLMYAAPASPVLGMLLALFALYLGKEGIGQPGKLVDMIVFFLPLACFVMLLLAFWSHNWSIG